MSATPDECYMMNAVHDASMNVSDVRVLVGDVMDYSCMGKGSNKDTSRGDNISVITTKEKARTEREGNANTEVNQDARDDRDKRRSRNVDDRKKEVTIFNIEGVLTGGQELHE